MRGAARTGRLAAVLVAAWVVLVVLLSCRGGAAGGKSGAGSAGVDGGVMVSKEAGGAMAETSVKRLGTVEIGSVSSSEALDEEISSAAVLWAGDRPAAVITLREKISMVLRYASQSFERIDGEGGPFPIKTHVTFVMDDRTQTDVYSDMEVHAADVDGDGVGELVLLRELGGVEVHGLKKTLFKHGIGKDFRPKAVHRARAGGKDVLYVLFKLEAKHREGAAERTAVLRVDARGITRLPLGDAVLRKGEVLAVGAVNRPGSQGIDELLVLSTPDDKTVFLSRHRPDGAPIDAPRKVYVPIFAGLMEFAFVPQSNRAVAFEGERAYFIEADKPVNWIRSVDLTKLDPHFLEVVDAASDPKVIVLGDKALYAVNQEGTYFTWNGGFVPSEKAQPFLRIAQPGPDFASGIGDMSGPDVLVQESGGEEILIVYSRKHRLREPPFEEVLKAAERFLDPEYVAREKADLEPRLENRDPVRDHDIEEEMKQKGIDQRPQTAEDWKRLLPQSYAKMAEDNRGDFIRGVLGEMELARDGHSNPPRHPDELKAWLAALDVPAETTFDLYRRGTRVGSFRAPGYFNRATDSTVYFRARGASATVVLPLEPTGEQPGQERAALFLVRWGGGR